MDVLQRENTARKTRLDELRQAALVRQESMLEYVAMMTDVELPMLDQEVNADEQDV